MSSPSRAACRRGAAAALALALHAGPATAAPDPEAVRAAVERAAGYLLRTSLENGRFVYLRDLDWTPADGRDAGDGAYNLLRHAGTMYALERYHDLTGDARVPPVLSRAEAELLRHVAPLPKAPWTAAVWSDPARLGGAAHGARYAKLGGAGLALVALGWLEARQPDAARLATLRSLGRFVVFMQRADGGFHSRYRPQSGFDESWHSLYYPGEAVLGLLSLHAVDPGPTWLGAAERGLRFLVESRAGDDVPPDHWALIATARYLERADPPASFRGPLLRHTEKIARRLLADAPAAPASPFFLGALDRHGAVAPTATRLEGLFAALGVLGAQSDDLPRRIRAATAAGTAFLLRAQARGGPMDGGFARLARPNRAAPPPDPSADVVRVDTVQHALTALIDSLETSAPPAAERADAY